VSGLAQPARASTRVNGCNSVEMNRREIRRRGLPDALPGRGWRHGGV